MRISDNGIFSRRSGDRKFRRSYFIAFEGLTELEYFAGVRNNKHRLGISDNIDIQLIERFRQDTGNRTQ